LSEEAFFIVGLCNALEYGNIVLSNYLEGLMRLIAIFTAVMMVLACSVAFAEIKPCDELKGEIDAKLQAKGVANYTLEVVPSDQVKDQKVVGSCDGGKMKIVYSKEQAK
jgi:hypothetical protein